MFFFNFLFICELKKNHDIFHKKIVFNIDNNKKYFLSTKSVGLC